MIDPMPTVAPNPPTWSPRAWGSAIGLLAFSGVTLIAVAAGHDPETVLFRATLSGAALAVLSLSTAAAVQVQRSPEDDE